MSSATFTETALESKSDVGHLTLRSSPLSCLNHGIPLDPLPENLGRDPAVPHSPPRPVILNDEERTVSGLACIPSCHLTHPRSWR